MTPLVALAVVAAVHAGFQVTVSAVVYPVLADRTGPDFAAAHTDHSRRIVRLVGPLYLAVLAVGAWVVVAAPLGPAVLVALGAQAVVLLTTAAVAAPAHGALGRDGPTPPLLRRLLTADRVRAGAAVVGLVAALVAVAVG